MLKTINVGTISQIIYVLIQCICMKYWSTDQSEIVENDYEIMIPKIWG